MGQALYAAARRNCHLPGWVSKSAGTSRHRYSTVALNEHAMPKLDRRYPEQLSPEISLSCAVTSQNRVNRTGLEIACVPKRARPRQSCKRPQHTVSVISSISAEQLVGTLPGEDDFHFLTGFIRQHHQIPHTSTYSLAKEFL